MLADTANLIVNLSLKGNFARELGKTQRALGTFDARLDKTESRAFRVGQQIGTGIRRGATLAAGGLLFLAGNVAVGLESLIDLEKQVAQTNAVLKSTKGAAGVTATAVGQMAEEFENLNATIGDEFIRGAENMLLTFTSIRKKAFRPALQAVLDLNTAMGNGPEGLTQTAIQVGKALNDPVIGLTALRRVGVSFTKEQVAKIKSLQKEGKLYEAQKIILKELNKEFGGSFLAQGGTTGAKVAKFRDAIDDLQRTLASGLLPVVSNVADALSKLLADPKVVRGVEDFGKSLAGLFTQKNLESAGRVLHDVLTVAAGLGPILTQAAGGIKTIIGAAVSAFKSLPPEIQKLAIAGLVVNKLTGGLVTNIAGGLISAVLKQLVSGVVKVQGATVIVNGPGGVGAGGVGGVAKGGLGVLGALNLAAIAASLALAVEEGVNLANQGTGASFQGPSAPFWVSFPNNVANAIGLILRTTLGPVVDDRAHEGSGQRRESMIDAIDRTTTAVEKFKAAAAPDLAKMAAGFEPGKNNPNFGGGFADTVKHNPANVAAGWAKIEDRRNETQAQWLERIKAANDRTTTAVETMKGSLGATLSGIRSANTATGIAQTAATRGVTRAIDRKDLSVTVPVNVSNRTVINGRLYNASVGKDITYINGLPYGGTPQGGR